MPVLSVVGQGQGEALPVAAGDPDGLVARQRRDRESMRGARSGVGRVLACSTVTPSKARSKRSRDRDRTSMSISRVVMMSGYVAGLNTSGEPCAGCCLACTSFSGITHLQVSHNDTLPAR